MSDWESIATLSITKNWQLTGVVVGSYFRFRYGVAIGFSHILIAQAQMNDEFELFTQQRLQVKAAVDILEIPAPFFFSDRRLAVRGIELSSPTNQTNSLMLEIEVNTVPISNPSAPNYPVSSTAASSTVNSATTSQAILVANTSRKGATVWNASTATLYLDLDAAASTSDYAAKLDPGGYYEVPYGFTGAISGIWSAANGSALVREFT